MNCKDSVLSPSSLCVRIANNSKTMGAKMAIRYHLRLTRHKKSLENNARIPAPPSFAAVIMTADIAGAKKLIPTKESFPVAST